MCCLVLCVVLFYVNEEEADEEKEEGGRKEGEGVAAPKRKQEPHQDVGKKRTPESLCRDSFNNIIIFEILEL